MVAQLADVEQLVVEEHERDAAQEHRDDGDDDVLAFRLFEIERCFDADGPQHDEQNVLCERDGVEDRDARFGVCVLDVDVAKDVNVGQYQGPKKFVSLSACVMKLGILRSPIINSTDVLT